DRGLQVGRRDGQRLRALRVKTVVASAAGPRYPLLAEIVRDPGVAAAARTRVIHDLVDARVGMLLELRLLVEIDRRAGQLADAAVRLDHAGALQQRDGGADGAPVDRRQPRGPVAG